MPNNLKVKATKTEGIYVEGTEYDISREFKIGFNYGTTTRGTELYLKDFEMYDITLSDNNAFSKDGNISYNEFNEVPEITSGVHNLKLGNETLPVLLDMDSDGGY
ncbi:MAG: hypothetical protein ACRC4Q_07725 [Paraclostridium dentum]